MKLPLINQECVVTWKGQRHLGVVRKAGLNWEKKYRIEVWSYSWGHAVEFKPEEVDLLEVKFADGYVYDAASAYRQTYSSAEMVQHMKAEQGGAQIATAKVESVTTGQASIVGVPVQKRMARRPLK